MNASPKLDLLVAEKVLKIPREQMRMLPIPCPDGHLGCDVLHTAPHLPNGVRLPAYSTDVTAALSLCEQMRLHRCALELYDAGLQGHNGGWRAVLYLVNKAMVANEVAPTAAHAICLAALTAVEWLAHNSETP